MWNIIESASRLLNSEDYSRLPAAIGHCLFGNSGPDFNYLLSDLELLIMPGLLDFGLNSILIKDLLASQKFVASSTKLPVFLKGKAIPNDTAAAFYSNFPEEPPVSKDFVLSHLGVLQLEVSTAQTSSEIRWENGSISELGSIEPSNQLALQIGRQTSRQIDRGSVTQSILRWVAFARANPDRILQASDSAMLQPCIVYMKDVAGKERSPAATRLRHSIEAMEHEDVETAFQFLEEFVLLRLEFPISVINSLLLPRDSGLSDVQIRELIYLSRAGSSNIKVLAAARLTAEPENRDKPDIASTLLQLELDENAWVRKAAKKNI